jgi:hypothetical protein
VGSWDNGFILKKPIVIITIILLACAASGIAADLKMETVEAFDRYIAGTEARLEPRFRGEHFLGVGDSPESIDKLQRGVTLIQPVKGGGSTAVPGGLIHDWAGAVFVPKTKLKEVLATVQDYDRHGDIYKPEIARGHVESHHGDDWVVFLRFVKSKFLLSDVLNTLHDIHYVTVSPEKVYSRSSSKRIAEVSDPGKPNEHEMPVGQDRGFLWRLFVYWFFEERDDGVYIACESITLTRDVPFGMGKLAAPLIRDLPGESLRATLEQTRKALVPGSSERP